MFANATSLARMVVTRIPRTAVDAGVLKGLEDDSAPLMKEVRVYTNLVTCELSNSYLSYKPVELFLN